MPSHTEHRASPRIQDYAAIGDGRSIALISRDGSVDWLCWPRFDSPSLFGALLDPRAGFWRLAPVAPFRTRRRYIDDTNVLETRMETDTGTVVLTDLMPVASEPDKRRLVLPEHEILRVAQCVQGEVELEMVFVPRPDYGRGRGRLRLAGKLGLRLDTAAGMLVLRSGIPLDVNDEGEARGRMRLRAGEVVDASLALAHDWIGVLPPLGERSREAIERSLAWWRGWAARVNYDGPCRDRVMRSALALKLLVYAPSGAVVAAPTTSLPERIGGELNWDYRFCWLRDASLTVRALYAIGCADEAHAFVDWLLQATRLSQPELRVLYDVHGARTIREHVLDNLAGYRGSRPVRIGNAAVQQLQLDVYGEVIDAVTHFLGEGGALDRETQKVLRRFGEYVCKHWNQPDNGIWEPRHGMAHHTHSRVLCWTALDRLLQLQEQGHLDHAPVAEFRENREQIRRDVLTRAWNSELDSYVSQLDGDSVDATLLLLPWYGFEDAASDRMRATYARVRQELGAGPLLYRYRSSDSPGEGAFGVCGFWAAEYLALGGGSAQQAHDMFERLCGYANDVGLFAEEIDPDTGDALGNFPQAFTHVGLINAAVSLARRKQGAQPRRRDVPSPRPGAEKQEARV